MENNKQNFLNMIKLLTFGIILYCGIQNYQLVISVLRYLLNLIFPFVLGGIIAFIFNVPMRAIERHLLPNQRSFDKFRRVCAYLLTLICVIGVFVLALFVIIPEVGNTIMIIIDQIPSAFHNFQTWIYDTTKNLPNVQSYLDDLDLNWTDISSHVVNILKTTGGTILTSSFGILSGIIGGVTTFVIALTFSIYLLFQKEKLSRQIKQTLYAVFSEKRADHIIYVGTLSNNIFSSFLSGQCIEAVILGIMFFITLSIFQFPYALLIGVVIALTALIPIFGAFIGCFVGIFLIIMVNPMQAVWFLIIFLILQQIEGNLIYPHVVGSSIGLPSIWVLAAVTIGASLMGIAGILLFIPLCSVCYTLFRSHVKKRLIRKAVSPDKWNRSMPLGEEIEENTEANSIPEATEEAVTEGTVSKASGETNQETATKPADEINQETTSEPADEI